MAATTGAACRKRRLAIEIDAGQAFGTAHHASTRGCLLALDDLLKRERPRVVLDIGTGTGILAIAAAKALQATGARERQRPARGRDRGGQCAEERRRVAVARAVSAQASRIPSFGASRPILLLANLLERALLRPCARPRAARCRARRDRHSLRPHPNPGASNRGAHPSAFGFILEKRIILDGWTTPGAKRVATPARSRD